MNYFELFDMPLAPTVNKALLAEKYFALQKKSHPDFFSQSTEAEQEEALDLSADINKAFTIFRDDQKTIEYFLQVTGHIAADEKYALDPAFLMEMMEMNETLMEVDEGEARKRVADYEATLFEEIAPILKDYQAGEQDSGKMELLKGYYYKKKYLRRILDRLAD
jgi:molecular chaperone HscB